MICSCVSRTMSNLACSKAASEVARISPLLEDFSINILNRNLIDTRSACPPEITSTKRNSLIDKILFIYNHAELESWPETPPRNVNNFSYNFIKLYIPIGGVCNCKEIAGPRRSLYRRVTLELNLTATIIKDRIQYSVDEKPTGYCKLIR